MAAAPDVVKQHRDQMFPHLTRAQIARGLPLGSRRVVARELHGVRFQSAQFQNEPES
jgi:hypothetical protein